MTTGARTRRRRKSSNTGASSNTAAPSNTGARTRRRRKPPLDRDQAMVPITQRQERDLDLDQPLQFQSSEGHSATNLGSESSVGASLEHGRPEIHYRHL